MTCKKVKLNKGAKKVVSAFRKSDRRTCGCRIECGAVEAEDRAVDQIMNKKRGK